MEETLPFRVNRRRGGRSLWKPNPGQTNRLGASGQISDAENSLNLMVLNFTRFLITARIIRCDPKVEKNKKMFLGTFSRKILPHNVDMLKCRSLFTYTFYPLIHSTLLISSFEYIWLTGGECMFIIGKCIKLIFFNPNQHFFSEILKEKSIQKVVHCDSFDKLKNDCILRKWKNKRW